MKKALLITGGTVAGLAAVLSYTPAQLTSASGSISPTSGGATIDSGAPATPSTQVPTETTVPTPTPTQTSAPAPAPAPTSAPAPAPTSAPAPAPTSASAPADVTVTGRGYNAGGFGTVSVQITVTNGVVTAAKAVSYPNRDNRSAWISQQAIPWLVEQTLAAKDSANVAGVGGATYTSGAWINSLQSALTAAGL